MMQSVTVLSADPLFARLLMLECSPYVARTTCLSELPDRDFSGDILLYDLDSLPYCEPRARLTVCICRDPARFPAAADRRLLLPRPFRIPRLLSLCGLIDRRRADAEEPLPPAAAQFFFRGRQISLTPREERLLRVLQEAGGAAVSRPELLRRAFDGEGSETLVGVYIHYLRGKLEGGGAPIIRCCRGEGYRLCGVQAEEE